jgi:uroporphyrinogen-III synthase
MQFAKIIITRPQTQNIKLQKRLSEIFLEHQIDIPVISLPLIEIVPVDHAGLAEAIHHALLQAKWVSFVSPNAFLMSDRLLKKHGLKWPSHLHVAVVGGGSEKSIIDAGISFQQIVKPTDLSAWDSEGLWQALQHTQADWKDCRMVMIHGVGGRDFLAENLTDAGAQIEEFSVYQRQALSLDDPAWKLIDPTQPSLWVFNSSQAGDFLATRLPELGIDAHFLSHDKAIVSHPRIYAKIQQIGLGFVQMIEPGDEDLIKTLLHLCKTAL